MGDTTFREFVYGHSAQLHPMLLPPAAGNSYAGQIALLRRQAGAWPPERGGDSVSCKG